MRPLGLRNTFVPDGAGISGPHAHGYQILDGELVDVTSWTTDAKAATQPPVIGRIITTALSILLA